MFQQEFSDFFHRKGLREPVQRPQPFFYLLNFFAKPEKGIFCLVAKAQVLFYWDQPFTYNCNMFRLNTRQTLPFGQVEHVPNFFGTPDCCRFNSESTIIPLM